MKCFLSFVLFLIISFFNTGYSQTSRITGKNILSDADLISLLKPANSEIIQIRKLAASGNVSAAVEELAGYFKEKFSGRYFFSWKNFDKRLHEYAEKFPSEKNTNLKAAAVQMSLYPASVQWELPFKDLKGNNVTAYELRHLSRQEKALNMAFAYFYSGEDTSYLNYFVKQVASLNRALEEGKYDNAGNGVYESYRAGNRMFNWLFVHNAFLASKKYNWRDQVLLIKTFLQTGAQLEARTKKFSYGNHQTKGLSSLFQLAVMLPEFKGTDKWLEQSLAQMQLHLQREINSDGFQFERSVHYHIGDIDNYFYVYQLAKINHIILPPEFVTKLKSMFEAMVKIAQPDNTLPVLQDDTDQPWSEFNDIQNVMTLGAILFDDKSFRYFSSDDITSDKYWLIKPEYTGIIYKEKGTRPEIHSVSLDKTGYYVMRNGWKSKSEYMILSAGLSKEKPDHQHGDMLGLVAYANGNAILPNYQVRYFLPDYPFFKNSWTKSVALVDSIPQGRYWQPNSGGTGFGKWLVLPKPKTIQWLIDDHFDYYSGTHNGYDSLGVKYYREVYFFNSGFWIVRDNFFSEGNHNYQQVWQGHYSEEIKGNYLRSSFRNGSGLDIVQLDNSAHRIYNGSFHGKGNAVYQTKHKGNYTYTTLVFPYNDFGGRLDFDGSNDSVLVKNILLIKNHENNKLKVNQIITDASYVLQINGSEILLVAADNLKIKKSSITFSGRPSFKVSINNGTYTLTCLGYKKCRLEKSEFTNLKIENAEGVVSPENQNEILPGDKIILIQ